MKRWVLNSYVCQTLTAVCVGEENGLIWRVAHGIELTLRKWCCCRNSECMVFRYQFVVVEILLGLKFQDPKVFWRVFTPMSTHSFPEYASILLVLDFALRLFRWEVMKTGKRYFEEWVTMEAEGRDHWASERAESYHEANVHVRVKTAKALSETFSR